MHEGAVAAADIEDGTAEPRPIGGDALLRHPGVLLGRVAVDARVVVPGIELPVARLAQRDLLALYAAMPAHQDRQAVLRRPAVALGAAEAGRQEVWRHRVPCQ